MRGLLLSIVAACAVPDEMCEPYIEYDRSAGPSGAGCLNLEFYEIPIPDAWYPVDTRARVDECNRRDLGERLFECEPDGTWRELFFYDPPRD